MLQKLPGAWFLTSLTPYMLWVAAKALIARPFQAICPPPTLPLLVPLCLPEVSSTITWQWADYTHVSFFYTSFFTILASITLGKWSEVS